MIMMIDDGNNIDGREKGKGEGGGGRGRKINLLNLIFEKEEV